MAESEVDWWYVGKDGEKTGPACVDVLEGLWLAGELDGLSMVWREGLPNYIPLAESELKDLFKSLDDDEEEDIEGNESVAEGNRDEPKPNPTVPQYTAKQLWDQQWASNSDSGATYYANLYTQESSWEPPKEPLV
jgi:hypothetical protein